MKKFREKCLEVLDKTEWVAIASTGPDGPHIAGTWGSYIRSLGTDIDEIIFIPAGGYVNTETNLAKDNRIELLCASQRVAGSKGQGAGCRIRGTGKLETTGEVAETVKKKFPWARGVLIVKVDEVFEQL